MEDVKKMMTAAESPTAAATRVVNTMHGRKAGDVDGDDDLLVSNTVISLKDPLSGTRIQTAARYSSACDCRAQSCLVWWILVQCNWKVILATSFGLQSSLLVFCL